jgi:hypothetical protein
MPWRHTSPLAPKTPFLTAGLRDRLAVTAPCALYGLRRQTGDTWLDRDLLHGPQGLAARSRRPGTSPRHLGGPSGPLAGVPRTRQAGTARPPRAQASHAESRHHPPGATLRAPPRQCTPCRDACTRARPPAARARRPPTACDAPSPRHMPTTRPPLDDPDRFEGRDVSANGGIRWHSPWGHRRQYVCRGQWRPRGHRGWGLERRLRPPHTWALARTPEAHRGCLWETHTPPVTVPQVSGLCCDLSLRPVNQGAVARLLSGILLRSGGRRQRHIAAAFGVSGCSRRCCCPASHDQRWAGLKLRETRGVPAVFPRR